MTVHLTFDRVVTDLQRIATLRGDDYVYPLASQTSCHYRWNQQDLALAAGLGIHLELNAPACIVGQLAADEQWLDALVPDVRSDDHDTHQVNSSSVSVLLNRAVHAEVVTVEEEDWADIERLLMYAQRAQDNGEPWPHAVQYAVAQATYHRTGGQQ